MSQHLGAVQAVPVSTAREAHPYWQATVQNVPIQLQNHHLRGANLAYEEHHRHALRHFPNAGVTFYGDHKAGRVGVFTTDNIKYAAMDLFNVAQVNRCKHFVSRDPKETNSVKLRKQLQVHSFQFKEALNAFQKSRTALPVKLDASRTTSPSVYSSAASRRRLQNARGLGVD